MFESCVADIDSKYRELGHTLGWRFLCMSRDVLRSPVRVALLTINPAGDCIPQDHPWASCEEGTSFLVESWNGRPPGTDTLQVQVQKLFELLAKTLRYVQGHKALMSQSLLSHFVPFRSPRIADLHNKEESIKFGRTLWKKLLPHSSPQLIMCLGREVQLELRQLIPTVLSCELKQSKSFATGWGHYTADIDTYVGAGGIRRLLYLPHLSTWTLFTSLKSKANM